MRAREAQVEGQLQAERGRLTQLQNQISEMERAIDTAIGQMTAQ